MEGSLSFCHLSAIILLKQIIISANISQLVTSELLAQSLNIKFHQSEKLILKKIKWEKSLE